MTVFDKLWSISIHFIHSVWLSRLHSRSRSCPDLAVSHSHAMLFPVAVDDVQEDLTETRTVGEMVMRFMSSYRKNTYRHSVNHCDTLQSNHRQCEVFNVVGIFWWIPGAKEFVPSLTLIENSKNCEEIRRCFDKSHGLLALMQRWVLWRPLQRLRPTKTKTWSTKRAKTKTTTCKKQADKPFIKFSTMSWNRSLVGSLWIINWSMQDSDMLSWSKSPALRTWPSETGTPTPQGCLPWRWEKMRKDEKSTQSRSRGQSDHKEVRWQ